MNRGRTQKGQGHSPAHKASRRSGRGYTLRRVDVLEVQQTFLIVCEGEKTEPNYFRRFRVPKKVVDVRGLGDSTLSLVERTIGLMQDQEYNQVWCVFDRDSFPAVRFNAAIEKARANDVRVAYSNEAFEIWYLLHFHYYDTALTRAQNPRCSPI